ncbi:MAG TPA: SDR family oxidoreductase, partial [Pirellulales bacterium]
IQRLVAEAIKKYGPIDLFCSNAGIATGGGVEAPDSDWQKIWDVHVMAHIYAARAVLPSMVERGQGYLLQTASAAGLLTSIGSAPYAVTKHGAVAFAEWLAITYGPAIKVSCLCPQGVTTDMLMGPNVGPATEFLRREAITPQQVADSVIEGLAAEQFLILPHPVVAEYVARRAADHDRWIRGMRRIQAEIQAAAGQVRM